MITTRLLTFNQLQPQTVYKHNVYRSGYEFGVDGEGNLLTDRDGIVRDHMEKAVARDPAKPGFYERPGDGTLLDRLANPVVVGDLVAAASSSYGTSLRVGHVTRWNPETAKLSIKDLDGQKYVVNAASGGNPTNTLLKLNN